MKFKKMTLLELGIAFLLLLFSCTSYARSAAYDRCMASAGSEEDARNCDLQEAKLMDKQMSSLYKKLEAKLSNQKALLKKSQAQWEGYSKATCELMVSPNDEGDVYSNCRVRMKEKRIKELQELLKVER